MVKAKWLSTEILEDDSTIPSQRKPRKKEQNSGELFLWSYEVNRSVIFSHSPFTATSICMLKYIEMLPRDFTR